MVLGFQPAVHHVSVDTMNYGPRIYYPQLVDLPPCFKYLRVVKPWWARVLHAIGINYGYYVVDA